MLLTFSLSACYFDNTYLDRPEDIQQGKKFVDSFYENVKNKDYKGLDLMASDTIKKVSGPDIDSKLTKFINSKAGDYVSYKIFSDNSKVIVGSDNISYYSFKVNVKYQKGVIAELLGLEKIGNSEIKIVTYRAYSDLLMK